MSTFQAKQAIMGLVNKNMELRKQDAKGLIDSPHNYDKNIQLSIPRHVSAKAASLRLSSAYKDMPNQSIFLDKIQSAQNLLNSVPNVPVPPVVKPDILKVNGGLVTVILSGGLGNRIFQIFAGLAYARKHTKQFVLCKSLYQAPMRPHEENTDSMIDYIFPNIEYVTSFNTYSVAQERRHMEYDELPYYNGNVLIKGYFQVEQYSLELPYLPVIRNAYYTNTYFIHIRLGDYIGFFGMDFDLSKYHRICFDILGPNAKYIVFSNDNIDAKKYIDKFNINYTISDKTDALETLIEMSNCAGGICANSTFSWMGAFFQRQPRENIYVPNKWISGGTVHGIYPSWALRIDV